MKLVSAALLALALVLPVAGFASPASAITGIQAAPAQTTIAIHKHKKAAKKAHKGHRHHKHHKKVKPAA